MTYSGSFVQWRQCAEEIVFMTGGSGLRGPIDNRLRGSASPLEAAEAAEAGRGSSLHPPSLRRHSGVGHNNVAPSSTVLIVIVSTFC